MDFIKYGFILFLLSMAVVWIIGFLGIYNIIGFPEGVLETAKGVLESGVQ